MIPMVPMKSSTGMPLSTWMFLKTESDVCNFGGAAWGAAKTLPTSQMTVMTATARIGLNQVVLNQVGLNHDFIKDSPQTSVFGGFLTGNGPVLLFDHCTPDDVV